MATSLDNQKTFIVKMISHSFSSPPEIEKCSLLSHPNIIKFERVCRVDDWWIICMEYASKGDIISLLQQHGRLSESAARKIFYQLLQALNYLHSQGIAHRDVKLDNLLLTEQDRLILTDFEFCQTITVPSAEKIWGGTLLYSSPEVRNGTKNGTEADMWAAGVTLFALVFGRFPFSAQTLKEKREEEALVEAQKDTSVSETFKDLITRLLVNDPTNRITASQALKHRWCHLEEVPHPLSLVRKNQTPEKRPLPTTFQHRRVGLLQNST